MAERWGMRGGPALAALGALAAASGAHAQETGFVFGPEASEATLRLGGRVFLDAVRQEVDGGAAIGSFTEEQGRVRQARLTLEGDLTDTISFVAEADFGGGDTTADDVYVEYRPTEGLALRFGNLKTLALEQITSDTVTTFMERGPYADVTQTGRLVTAAAFLNGETWTLTGAVSGDSINDDAVEGDEQRSVQARATWAPVNRDDLKVHLGAWVRGRDRNDDDPLNYRARPNTDAGERYVSTGGIGQKDVTYALEGAVVRGPVSVQGEYALIAAERTAGSDFDVTAGYAFVSWFPTGESRRYRPESGDFGRIRIARPVTEGGPGAFELALRYDRVDLEDARNGPLTPARAGIYNGVTAGVNWYPVENVRFMANYTASDNSNPDDRFDADVNTLQVRAQVVF